ncbi:MAG: Arabinose 5-phosphate isomerase KdsD [Planctomycetota bacterium]
MLGAGLRPLAEVLRFKVGENLACVDESMTVGASLTQGTAGRRAGAVVVIDAAGRLSGIFTDGDLRRLLHERGAATLDLPIGTVMTRAPRCLPIDSLVRDAVRLVRERRIDEIPVVDAAGRPAGLVDVQALIARRVVSE